MAAVVGFAILPWNLLKDSNRFTSYLSAYSVFLSSIAGVMVRTASIGLSFSSRTRLMQTKRRTFSSRSQNTSSSEGATTAFQTYTILAAAAGTITRPVLTFGSSVYLRIGALPFFPLLVELEVEYSETLVFSAHMPHISLASSSTSSVSWVPVCHILVLATWPNR